MAKSTNKVDGALMASPGESKKCDLLLTLYPAKLAYLGTPRLRKKTIIRSIVDLKEFNWNSEFHAFKMFSTLGNDFEDPLRNTVYIFENVSLMLKKTEGEREKRAQHLIRHKSTCHCIYFMPLECVVYTVFFKWSLHGHYRSPCIPSISWFLLMLQYCDTEW